MAVTLRPMSEADASAVLRIYQGGHGLGPGQLRDRRPDLAVLRLDEATEHRFVAEDEQGVLGWVAVSQVSARPVYAGIVEHSMYVHPEPITG